MLAHTFNPSTREAEADGSVSLRPAWFTRQVPGQPELLHRETLSSKTKTPKQKQAQLCMKQVSVYASP